MPSVTVVQDNLHNHDCDERITKDEEVQIYLKSRGRQYARRMICLDKSKGLQKSNFME